MPSEIIFELIRIEQAIEETTCETELARLKKLHDELLRLV